MKYLIAICCSLLLSTQSLAQPATLLSPDLEPSQVTLRSLSPELVRVLDTNGEAMELSHQQVLRLSMNHGSVPKIDSALSKVTLRDGQVIVGRLVPSSDEEAVRVKLDAGRTVQVSLDAMLSLAIQLDAPLPKAEEDDALLLVTGEVLLGFVATFSKTAVGFVIGDADDPIDIPLDRIKALSIANKPKQPDLSHGTMRVTTVDGSVLFVEDVALTDVKPDKQLVGTSTLPILSSGTTDEGLSSATSSRIILPMNRILAIETTSSQHQLSSLSDHEWKIMTGGEVFGVKMPPRVTADGSIRLHAPTTLGFDLPKGASRVVFTVAMDLDNTIPASRRAMAGCELIVYDGDNAIAQHTLTPDSAPKRLNLPLGRGDFRIALEAGVNGPVLDRVIFSQGELLVSE